MKTIAVGICMFGVAAVCWGDDCTSLGRCTVHKNMPITVTIGKDAKTDIDCISICADNMTHKIKWAPTPAMPADQWIVITPPGLCMDAKSLFSNLPNQNDTCVVQACKKASSCAHSDPSGPKHYKYWVFNVTTFKAMDPEIIVDGGMPPPPILLRVTAAGISQGTIPKGSDGASVTWLYDRPWSVHFDASPCLNGADFSSGNNQTCSVPACPAEGPCNLPRVSPYTIRIDGKTVPSTLIIEGGRDTGASQRP